MSKFEGVADTLYIPLTALIYVSEYFPEYFRDDKAVSLKSEMPYEDIASKSGEYFQMAGACRFYNTDQMIKAFVEQHEKCNIVNVGCGLETSYFRIKPAPEKAAFYEMDLPEVIFDAMTGKAIKYANDYIKKTDNNDAELHFSADNGKSVAEKCGMKLVEERPFFGAARKQLKRKLKLYTRIAMKVVDEGGRRGFLTHLQG
ncbi:MAG: class I SAM-dependent methyltransferase [Firmicutes bacterium]|nr:class I SAM-dependent methyltransferase [Bacillota bacterium]MBP3901579.1 class I SAM-dependent methyltransferase [Blautia sp.]